MSVEKQTLTINEQTNDVQPDDKLTYIYNLIDRLYHDIKVRSEKFKDVKRDHLIIRSVDEYIMVAAYRLQQEERMNKLSQKFSKLFKKM